MVEYIAYRAVDCSSLGKRYDVFYCLHFTGSLRAGDFPAIKQPPPATVSMVAGGGDLPLFLLMFYVWWLNELSLD